MLKKEAIKEPIMMVDEWIVVDELLVVVGVDSLIWVVWLVCCVVPDNSLWVMLVELPLLLLLVMVVRVEYEVVLSISFSVNPMRILSTSNSV